MERYKKLFNEGFDNFENIKIVIGKLADIFKSKHINFCFLGGIAVNQYAKPRMTEDIDILIDKKDRIKFESLIGVYLKKAFQGSTKIFYWNNPKVKVDVLYSGEKAGSEKGIEYENPESISMQIESIPIINIENLIKYKLASGLYGQARLQDFADIQHIITKHNLKINFADKLRIDLKNKYIEIWNDTNNQKME